jgi:hypothetical protein
MSRIPGARVTSSPALAARLARETLAIRLTPARQVVLLHAARLWCRDLAFPTARLLAESIHRSPSTVLNGFETMPRIHAEIIRREWDGLSAHEHSANPSDWLPWLLGHLQALCELDRALLRLPSFVLTAIDADAPCADRRPVSQLSLAVNVVAAFATPAVDFPHDAQLRRITLSVVSALRPAADNGHSSLGGRAA